MTLTLAATTIHSATSFLSVENLVALITLTALEIVLGIDNVVFIALLCGRLPEHQRDRARRTGLALALVTRILFLTTLTYVIGLAQTSLFTIPWFTEMIEKPGVAAGAAHVLVEQPLSISGRDLILIIGGAFLIAKATMEIHHKLEDHADAARKAAVSSFWPIIAQILVIDLVFSLDSVITAVGMARSLVVMITAVVISVGIMLVFAGHISRFIERHPTMKMLALAFLVLIGVVLVADGLGRHIEKGYIYFAMAFSLAVETLNLISRRKRDAAGAAAH